MRLALFKDLGETNSPQEVKLLETSTREYLQKAFSNNEFISYIAEKNREPLSISGMVLFKGPPYLENLQGIEAYILNMYTVPKYHGNGFAKRLFELCIDEGKKEELNELGCTLLRMGDIYTKNGLYCKGKRNGTVPLNARGINRIIVVTREKGNHSQVISRFFILLQLYVQ